MVNAINPPTNNVFLRLKLLLFLIKTWIGIANKLVIMAITINDGIKTGKTLVKKVLELIFGSNINTNRGGIITLDTRELKILTFTRCIIFFIMDCMNRKHCKSNY